MQPRQKNACAVSTQIGKACEKMTKKMKTKNAAVLHHFIEDYLSAARKYSAKYGKEDNSLFGCDAPCQVHVVWFEKPSVQVLLFTHLKNKSDKLIRIYGPYCSFNAVQTFERLLNKGSFLKEYFRTLSKDSQGLAREIIENEFIAAVRTIQRLIERGEPKKTIHRSACILPRKATLWICEGFLPTMGIKRLCDELGVSRRPSEKEDDEYCEGWGTYYYPPIRLGPKSLSDFRHKVKMRMHHSYIDKKSYVGDYAGHKVYIGKEGFICVLCEDPVTAFHVLNTIFAISLVKGVENFPVKPPEMQRVRFNIAAEVFDIISPPSTRRTLRTSHFRHRASPLKYLQEEVNVSRVRIRNIVKHANEVMADREIVKVLRLFHEAYVHMKNYEFNSAFTLAWTIIESWISRQWVFYLRKKKLTGNNIRKLADWNVDAMIQSLFLSGNLDRDTKNRLDALRIKRNKIVHRGQFASKKDVENCVQLAFRFLKKYIPTTRLALPSKRRLARPRKDIAEAFKVELIDDL